MFRDLGYGDAEGAHVLGHDDTPFSDRGTEDGGVVGSAQFWPVCGQGHQVEPVTGEIVR